MPIAVIPPIQTGFQSIEIDGRHLNELACAQSSAYMASFVQTNPMARPAMLTLNHNTALRLTPKRTAASRAPGRVM
jgi:hypothetical protein